MAGRSAGSIFAKMNGGRMVNAKWRRVCKPLILR